jgi:hypothetical protein
MVVTLCNDRDDILTVTVARIEPNSSQGDTGVRPCMITFVTTGIYIATC